MILFRFETNQIFFFFSYESNISCTIYIVWKFIKGDNLLATNYDQRCVPFMEGRKKSHFDGVIAENIICV